MKFKFLPHTADIKFQAFGKTVEEVFENSAYALVNIMYKGKIKDKMKKKIKVKGKDKESLLYNFLEEFLFLVETKGFLLAKISKLKIKDNKLEAEITGDEEDRLQEHIKAITYNQMFVKKQGDKFICQVVVDV